jgi:transcriptional regulator with XRE-family HTH domain
MLMGRTSARPIKGEMLREARLRKFMSQADVLRGCAERGLALDQTNLSKIERGRIRWPALRVIPVLADVLGIDVEDLFQDEVAA